METIATYAQDVTETPIMLGVSCGIGRFLLALNQRVHTEGRGCRYRGLLTICSRATKDRRELFSRSLSEDSFRETKPATQ